MAQILPITPTLLSKFLSCPRQYMGQYITKEVVWETTPAQEYGNTIHSSVEHTLKEGKPLVPEAVFMQPLVDLCNQLVGQGMVMEVEKELAVSKDMKPCGWRGPKRGVPAWMRGKADVFFRDDANKRNIIIDWKTGKVKEDSVQSDILSVCATQYTGYTENVCMWVFVTKDDVIITNLKLNDLSPVSDTLQSIARYEDACKNDHFPAIRNGLCGKYCGVMSCEYNGRRTN